MRPYKLMKLAEQHLSAGKGNKGYRETFRDLLGITENSRGEPTLDTSKRELNPRDVSFQEVAWEFLGRDYKSKLRDVAQLSSLGTLSEAGGNVVLPSHFANISAFSDTVAGLVDAMVMEAYQAPEFIGDKIFQTIPTRVNGGKMIGVRNDGTQGERLLDSEPYPAVGMAQTFVDIPDNERRGQLIQLSMHVFTYDRTDQVQSAAETAGYATRRAKEIRQADYALGIVNNYARDGVSANTYLATAGASPNDYVNSSANSLDTWEDIDDAIHVLSANTDPSTGFEISLSPPFDLLVAPQAYMTVSTIVRATSISTRDSGGTGTNANQQIREASNPLPSLNLISMNYVWYNRLILAAASGGAGLSAQEAQARWHLGNFQKAFGYRQLLPFESVEVTPSSEEVRRDIILCRVVREHGTPFVKEPRYSYQGTIGGV